MYYLCTTMDEGYDFGIIDQGPNAVFRTMDPQNHKGLNPCREGCGCEFKKCCKKYKKGKRCKKCPKR